MDRLFDVLLVVSVPIFVLVVAVVLFCAWRFRVRPGEELKDGPPIHGSTPLEIVWTAVPALLIAGLVAYSWVVLDDVERKRTRTLVVEVTAQQFAWSFEYPQSAGKAVRSSTLVLPQGRPVEFRVRSLDVVHGFWVPEFRAKIDAVPGIVTTLRVTPSRAGRYSVVCAELCGLGHAVMRAGAVVVPAGQFERWLQRSRPTS